MFDTKDELRKYCVIPDFKNIREVLDKYGIYYEEEYDEENDETLLVLVELLNIPEMVIGSGSNGMVVDLGTRVNDVYKVLKLTQHKPEIDYYEQIYEHYKITKDQDIIDLLVIPEVYYFIDQEYDKRYMCFMDYLNPLEPEEEDLFELIDLTILRNIDTPDGLVYWENHWSEIITFNEAKEFTPEQLMEIKVFCERALRLLYRYRLKDAHSGNILKDDNGNYRLVDLMI